MVLLPMGVMGQTADNVRFKVNVNDGLETAATVTYTTGHLNWTQTWDSNSNKFDFTGGFAEASWGDVATNGQVAGRFFTDNGATTGVTQPLRVGQKVVIRISGGDADGRTGVETNGRIGISFRSSSGIFDDGGTGSAFNRLAHNARLRLDFLGGGTSARHIGASTITTGMPGFSDFKAGQTYEIEIISANEYNLQVVSGMRYNVVLLSGSGEINQIIAYNIGKNMNARFTDLAVVDLATVSLRSNASETKTVTGVISDNGSTANSVTKVGSGLAILNGNHTYTGATAVEEGTLRINGTFESSGFTVKSGAILEINSASVINDLVVEDGGAVNIIGSGLLTVNGDINVHENGTLALSSTIGGDIKTSGNVTFNGTFTHNDRAVFFTGAGDQILTKSTGDSVVEIPYVIVNKDDNADRVTLNATHLRITQKLTLTSGVLDRDTGTITLTSTADGTAVISGVGDGEINQTFTVERHIGRTGNPDSSFLMIGSPLIATLTGSSSSLFNNIWTQGTTGGNGVGSPNVFRYDESLGMNGWTPVTDLTAFAVRGWGYLVGVYRDDDAGSPDGSWPKTLRVTGTFQGSENNGAEVPLSVSYSPEVGEADSLRGWSLVANPFVSQLDWNSESGWTRTNISPTYQVLTENGTYQGYNHSTDAAFNGGSNIIQTFQGFWVKAIATSPSLTVSSAAKVEDQDAAFQKDQPVPALWLDVRDGDRQAGTTLTFREDGSVEADLNDAPYMRPLVFGALALATRPQSGGGLLSLQHLPVHFDILEIPLVPSLTDRELTFRVSQTRAWPENWHLFLREIDGTTRRLTVGEDLSLKAGHQYTLIIDPSNTTSAENRNLESGIGFELAQNYPNPFNPSTQIRFSLLTTHHARLTVFDALGREVAVLLNGSMPAGSHTVTFEASNLTSGVYLYKLEAGGETLIRRMTLIK